MFAKRTQQHPWISCGATRQLRRSQYCRCPGARHAFVSRFQHPPQTTGNEANFSAGDRAAGWPQHQFQMRLNCARATFYAYALPFNVVQNILRILTFFFCHTEEGLYTRNVCVDRQF